MSNKNKAKSKENITDIEKQLINIFNGFNFEGTLQIGLLLKVVEGEIVYQISGASPLKLSKELQEDIAYPSFEESEEEDTFPQIPTDKKDLKKLTASYIG